MVMRLHGRKLSVKAVSQLIATIILIAIVLIGGLFAFAVWNNFANIEAQKAQVSFEYLALYKGLGEPKAVFAATLKNTGSKPIKSLVIKLHNESAYQILSVSELFPLAPGKSTGVTLTPPLIHADWYIVGYRYVVTVFGVAVDGSAFSHTASVICMGQGGTVPGGALGSVTFQLLSGPSGATEVLIVNGVTYLASELPKTITGNVGDPLIYEWLTPVEEDGTTYRLIGVYGYSGSVIPEGGAVVSAEYAPFEGALLAGVASVSFDAEGIEVGVQIHPGSKWVEVPEPGSEPVYASGRLWLFDVMQDENDKPVLIYASAPFSSADDIGDVSGWTRVTLPGSVAGFTVSGSYLYVVSGEYVVYYELGEAYVRLYAMRGNLYSDGHISFSRPYLFYNELLYIGGISEVCVTTDNEGNLWVAAILFTVSGYMGNYQYYPNLLVVKAYVGNNGAKCLKSKVIWNLFWGTMGYCAGVMWLPYGFGVVTECYDGSWAGIKAFIFDRNSLNAINSKEYWFASPGGPNYSGPNYFVTASREALYIAAVEADRLRVFKMGLGGGITQVALFEPLKWECFDIFYSDVVGDVMLLYGNSSGLFYAGLYTDEESKWLDASVYYVNCPNKFAGRVLPVVAKFIEGEEHVEKLGAMVLDDISPPVLVVDSENPERTALVYYNDLPATFLWKTGTVHSYEWMAQIDAGKTLGNYFVVNKWIDGDGLTPSISGEITVEGDDEGIAYYEPERHFILAISVSGAGSTSLGPGIHLYGEGEQVAITASPEPGHSARWWLDENELGYRTSLSLEMDESHFLGIFFEPNDFSIEASKWWVNLLRSETTTVEISVAKASGQSETVTLTVASSDPSISATLTTTRGAPPFSSTLRITAGNKVGDFKVTVTGRNNYAQHSVDVFVYVERPRYSVTVSSDNPSLGLVAFDGYTPVESCSGPAMEGERITVKAVPTSVGEFSGWTIDGSPAGSSNPLQIVVNGTHNIVAHFDRRGYLLRTAVNYGGLGSITPSPGDHSYRYQDHVTLTATPNAGCRFLFWVINRAYYTAQSVDLVIDKDYYATAYFLPETITGNLEYMPWKEMFIPETFYKRISMWWWEWMVFTFCSNALSKYGLSLGSGPGFNFAEADFKMRLYMVNPLPFAAAWTGYIYWHIDEVPFGSNFGMFVTYMMIEDFVVTLKMGDISIKVRGMRDGKNYIYLKVTDCYVYIVPDSEVPS